MSKTDKTTPYRVIMVRDGVETHDHRFGRVCDFDKFDPAHPWRTHCGYRIPDMKWSRSMKYFGRPRHAHEMETALQRANRHKVKRVLMDSERDFDNISFTSPLDSAWFIN